MGRGTSVPRSRLRLGGVVARGAVYGAGAAVCLTVTALVLRDDAGADLLEAVAFLGLVAGAVSLLTGLFFWACCSGEVLRWRDLFRTSGPSEVIAVLAPCLVRVGVLLLVPVPVAAVLGRLAG
ncbi:DUF6336 family protein [Streptomyces bacillaris]|uniref:DUF6336 family protein n=1 Tax=Streptomyces TaxID=1883 RepID=UPI00227973F0|nr:DUF6336 family protein [Streptomyces cavourensis]WAE67245.1 DUF6336 family protein [Streptomyces cavourensis]